MHKREVYHFEIDLFWSRAAMFTFLKPTTIGVLAKLELPNIFAYWIFGFRGSDIRLKTYIRLLVVSPAAQSYPLKEKYSLIQKSTENFGFS